ncbi:hypothetical protein DK37_11605, partial [Halomonas sp. SUBG004]
MVDMAGGRLAALAPLLYWSWMVANNAAGPEPGRYLLLNIGIGGLWMLAAHALPDAAHQAHP